MDYFKLNNKNETYTKHCIIHLLWKIEPIFVLNENNVILRQPETVNNISQENMNESLYVNHAILR